MFIPTTPEESIAVSVCRLERLLTLLTADHPAVECEFSILRSRLAWRSPDLVARAVVNAGAIAPRHDLDELAEDDGLGDDDTE